MQQIDYHTHAHTHILYDVCIYIGYTELTVENLIFLLQLMFGVFKTNERTNEWESLELGEQNRFLNKIENANLFGNA